MVERGKKKTKETRQEAKEDGIIRTVIVPSERLSYRTYFALAEVEREYAQMLKELVEFAYANGITSFTKLHTTKYHDMRRKYPDLPSHYVVMAGQDAVTRVKSFLKARREGRAYTNRPEVRRITVWLDDHLWKPEGRTAVRVATKRGWITVELRPHKQFWRYINSGWALRSEARFKLDHRKRVACLYLVFEKVVKPYEPKGYLLSTSMRIMSQCWWTM